jgi:hypothetical protein
MVTALPQHHSLNAPRCVTQHARGCLVRGGHLLPISFPWLYVSLHVEASRPGRPLALARKTHLPPDVSYVHVVCNPRRVHSRRLNAEPRAPRYPGYGQREHCYRMSFTISSNESTVTRSD